MGNNNYKKLSPQMFIGFLKKYILVFFVYTIIGYIYYFVVTPLLTEIPFLLVCILSKTVSCKWVFADFYHFYPTTTDGIILSLLIYVPGAIFAFGLPGMAMTENIASKKSNKKLLQYFITVNSILHLVPIIIVFML